MLVSGLLVCDMDETERRQYDDGWSGGCTYNVMRGRTGWLKIRFSDVSKFILHNIYRYCILDVLSTLYNNKVIPQLG